MRSRRGKPPPAAACLAEHAGPAPCSPRAKAARRQAARECYATRLARRVRQHLRKVYGGRLEICGGMLILIGGDTTLDTGHMCHYAVAVPGGAIDISGGSLALASAGLAGGAIPGEGRQQESDDGAASCSIDGGTHPDAEAPALVPVFSEGAAAADDESARPEFDECFISGSTTISWAEYVRLSTDYEADADHGILIDGYKFLADGSVLLDLEPAWYEIPVESENSEIEAGPLAADTASEGPQTTGERRNGADRKAA